MLHPNQKVIYTNEYSVCFGEKTITRMANERETFGNEPRYFITPTDTPWFPFAESELTPVESDTVKYA